MKNSVISLSGGLDSTSLMIHMLNLDYHVHAISFTYGQNHLIEVDRACRNIDYLQSQGFEDRLKHKVVDISDAMSIISSALTTEGAKIPEGYYEEESMRRTVVPNRNSIFASILFGYALSIANSTNHKTTLSLGVHSGDHAIYPDCRPEFYSSLYDAFAKGNWDSDRVEFYMPYIELDKSDILMDAKENCTNLGINFTQVFKNTITSYSPGSDGVSDGRTGSDIERILAFHKIGEKDPIPYTEPWDKVLEHAIKIENNFKK